MKRFLFLIVLVCTMQANYAQYIYTIKADSVKITNTCDTAELIIENHTQTVPGFLFNKGRGRTEFRKVFQNLTDNSFLIGGDTMRLSNVWMQGGNRFGATGLLGTNDNYPLTFLQNGTEKGRIEKSGNWLFNTTQDKGYLGQFNGDVWTSGTIYTEGRVNIVVTDNTHNNDNAISIGKLVNVTSLSGLSAIGLGYDLKVTSGGYHAFGVGESNSVVDGIGILGSTIQGIALGMDAFAHPKSIVMGGSAVSTAENQFVCGGPSSSDGNKSIENVYFGSGPQRGNKVEGPGVSYTINGAGALGNNNTGGNITIAGGKGTGTGAPGSIIFSTAQFTSSGTDLQELSEKARFDVNGNFGIGTSTPINKLDVHGTARFDNVLTTSGHKSAVRTTSTDVTIGDTDEYVFVNAASNVTVMLPNATGRDGQTYTIKKANDNGSSVIITNIVSQTIDGSNSYTLSGPWSYITVVASAGAWMIVSKN